MVNKVFIKKKKEKVELSEAWNELTERAFSSWIYLCSCTSELKSRGQVALYLGFTRQKTDRILRELELLKYIKMVNSGNGKPSKLEILKRPIIRRNINIYILNYF